MSRVNRLFLCLLPAAMITAFLMAGGAWASSPEDENETKTTAEVKFHGHGDGPITFRAERLGILGTLSCEKALTLGGAWLVPGNLATKFLIHLTGKCLLDISGEKTACTEPILTHTLTGLLGFIKAGSLTVGLLVKPDSGNEVLKATCGANTVTIDGEVVGEIPELNKAGAGQYNKFVSVIELRFARVAGKETEQAITTFELPTGFPSPLSMTGVSLSAAGFLGGKASLEATQLLLLASPLKINA